MSAENPTTKNFFLDQKDAAYYRNRFLNNCSMRSRYTTRLTNNINTFLQNLEQMEKLDNDKDPYMESDVEFTRKLRSLSEEIMTTIESYCQDLNAEMNELKAKDYEAIMNKNEQEIRDAELQQNHTELN